MSDEMCVSLFQPYLHNLLINKKFHYAEKNIFLSCKHHVRTWSITFVSCGGARVCHVFIVSFYFIFVSLY